MDALRTHLYTASMAKRKLKPFVYGIDQLSDETSLLENDDFQAVREAVNVDLDRDGNVSRRPGSTLELAGSGYHSLYASKRGWVFLCHKHQLGLYSSGVFTPLADMADALLTSYAELNGTVYAVNTSFSCQFPPNSTSAYAVGVPLPATVPVFAAAATGNLDPGTYGITYSVVAETGEESGTGPVTTIELPDGGGIQGTMFETLSGAKYRIYMTSANGEELYQALEFDANTASMLIAEHAEGRQPRTLDLEPLPYGYTVRAYNARLFVATSGFVYFSAAFRPHLHNPAHDFLPTTGFTPLLQPVDNGVFIGDQRGVRFYAGDDPAEFRVREVSNEVPIFGTGVSVPGDYLNAELGVGRDQVAVWLTTSGFNIGLPDGQLLRPNMRQVRLPSYTQGCVAPIVKDGRKQLITAVNSGLSGATGIAVDSYG